MKVLEIITVPFFQPRGTAFSSLHRTQVLAKLGYQIDIATYSIGEDIEIENTKIYRSPEVPFIQDIKMGPSFKKLVLEILLFFTTVRLLTKNKYNLVHAHEESAYWYGLLLKPIFKVPMIYDMHSSLPEQLENFKSWNKRIISYLFMLGERMVLRKSDSIIAICPHLVELARKHVSERQVTLIENLSIFNPKVTISNEQVVKLKKELGILGEQKIILYTGTFGKNQGIDLLVNTIPMVINKYPEVKYVLVGGTVSEIDEIKKLVVNMGVKHDVIFTGKRIPDEMAVFMEMADILVSPRIKGTNTPLKIYSYMASGKPIVATNLLTHRQVLDDTMACLVEPDAKQFADAILQLLSNRKLGKQLADAAREKLGTEYSYKAFFEKTRNVYELLQRRKEGQ